MNEQEDAESRRTLQEYLDRNNLMEEPVYTQVKYIDGSYSPPIQVGTRLVARPHGPPQEWPRHLSGVGSR